jgi:hypothetical protein
MKITLFSRNLGELGRHARENNRVVPVGHISIRPSKFRARNFRHYGGNRLAAAPQPMPPSSGRQDVKTAGILHHPIGALRLRNSLALAQKLDYWPQPRLSNFST